MDRPQNVFVRTLATIKDTRLEFVGNALSERSPQWTRENAGMASPADERDQGETSQ